MARKVVVYGKAGCPYTMRARQELARQGAEVEYRDVLSEPQLLEEMLRLNGGVRKVPTIVEAGRVQVGYGGT